jgi:integrase
VKVRTRKSGGKERLSVEFYYLRPGALAPERVRYLAPPSVTSESAALRWGQSMRRELEAGRAPPQSKAGRQQKAVEIAERREAEQRAAREAVTVRAWVDEYLADCEARRVRPTTIALRRTQLRPFVETCGDRRVAEVGVLDLQRLRRALSKLAPSSANRYAAIASTALRAAEAAGLRGPVPMLEPIRGVARDDVPERYSDDEAERLVAAAVRLSDEHLGIVLLGLDAGLRAGEIAGVRVEDVDLRRGIVAVVRTIVLVRRARTEHRPKSGKVRRVPLTPRLRDVLDRLVAASTDGWLFHGRDGRPASRPTIDPKVHTAQKAAGLPTKGPHKLRHTFSSMALESGATLEELRLLLGHSSIVQTARYTHAGAGSTRAAIDRLAARQAPGRSCDARVTGEEPARPRLATV